MCLVFPFSTFFKLCTGSHLCSSAVTVSQTFITNCLARHLVLPEKLLYCRDILYSCKEFSQIFYFKYCKNKLRIYVKQLVQKYTHAPRQRRENPNRVRMQYLPVPADKVVSHAAWDNECLQKLWLIIYRRQYTRWLPLCPCTLLSNNPVDFNISVAETPNSAQAAIFQRKNITDYLYLNLILLIDEAEKDKKKNEAYERLQRIGIGAKFSVTNCSGFK